MKYRVALAAALCLLALPSAFAREAFPRRTPTVMAVEAAGPAVVNVYTEEKTREAANPFRNFRGSPFEKLFDDFFTPFNSQTRQNLGSGVIIDPRGYVLTNEHVVARAAEIKVTLINRREFKARLIGADIRSDLAVIKIDAEETLPHIEMGRSDDLMTGETVIAIGNPFGLKHTVTQGIISALNRSIRPARESAYNEFIQVDASINPGNSGGPLLNINGELIGINTAIYQNAEGIGFAIPINHARRIVNELLHFGKVRRGWVGVAVQDLSGDMRQYFRLEQAARGVIVTRVFSDTPAERAGVKAGDLILALDDHPIESKADYQQKQSSYTLEDTLRMDILRDGGKQSLKMRVAAIPKTAAAEFALHWLGVKVKSITPELAAQYRLPARTGAVIVQADPNGACARVGIAPGDVIHQINQEGIKNEDDFNNAVIEAGRLNSVLLAVQRGRNIYHVTLEP